MNLHCNCCDGVYNSFDIHFTSVCDNKCSHCIDATCEGKHIVKPNADAIADTIIDNADKLNDVLFLGGEPCLFLDELIYCVQKIKKLTNLKVYVTTSVPKTCYDNRDKFITLIESVDGLNISAQHYDELIADEIRKTKSKYDRQTFYNGLPHKEKIRINLNIVKPYLYTKTQIIECLKHYDKMGFGAIRLSELQQGKEHYASFEDAFKIHLNSPYAHSCQIEYDMSKWIKDFKTPLILKRSCFLCESTRKASFTDGIKAVCKIFSKQTDSHYGVVYEDGTLEKGWI